MLFFLKIYWLSVASSKLQMNDTVMRDAPIKLFPPNADSDNSKLIQYPLSSQFKSHQQLTVTTWM